jgi:hypothetical protein
MESLLEEAHTIMAGKSPPLWSSPQAVSQAVNNRYSRLNYSSVHGDILECQEPTLLCHLVSPPTQHELLPELNSNQRYLHHPVTPSCWNMRPSQSYLCKSGIAMTDGVYQENDDGFRQVVSTDSYDCPSKIRTSDDPMHLVVHTPPVPDVPTECESDERPAKKKKWTKPAGMPKRPMSSYNLFFQLEHERLVNEGPEKIYTEEDVNRIAVVCELKQIRAEQEKRKHRKSHGKFSFTTLARVAADRWKALPDEQKKVFMQRAILEKQKYQKAVEIWAESKVQSSTLATNVLGNDKAPKSKSTNTVSMENEADDCTNVHVISPHKASKVSDDYHLASTKMVDTIQEEKLIEKITMPTKYNCEPTSLLQLLHRGQKRPKLRHSKQTQEAHQHQKLIPLDVDRHTDIMPASTHDPYDCSYDDSDSEAEVAPDEDLPPPVKEVHIKTWTGQQDLLFPTMKIGIAQQNNRPTCLSPPNAPDVKDSQVFPGTGGFHAIHDPVENAAFTDYIPHPLRPRSNMRHDAFPKSAFKSRLTPTILRSVRDRPMEYVDGIYPSSSFHSLSLQKERINRLAELKRQRQRQFIQNQLENESNERLLSQCYNLRQNLGNNSIREFMDGQFEHCPGQIYNSAFTFNNASNGTQVSSEKPRINLQLQGVDQWMDNSRSSRASRRPVSSILTSQNNHSLVVSPGTSLYGRDCHDTFSKMKHEEADVQRQAQQHGNINSNHNSISDNIARRRIGSGLDETAAAQANMPMLSRRVDATSNRANAVFCDHMFWNVGNEERMVDYCGSQPTSAACSNFSSDATVTSVQPRNECNQHVDVTSLSSQETRLFESSLLLSLAMAETTNEGVTDERWRNENVHEV